MNKKLYISFLICFLWLVGCDDNKQVPVTEKDIGSLIQKNIEDPCIYHMLDKNDSLSLNTVSVRENIQTDEIIYNKNNNIISIKDGDEKLLGQANVLENAGLLTKVSDYIIKDIDNDVYYDNSLLTSPARKKLPAVEKIKGYQFKLTSKGKTIIKRLYDSDDIIGLCIGIIKVDRIMLTVLPNNRVKVLAEMTNNAVHDWVENEGVIKEFGNLTDRLYEDSITGLIETYVIKTNNGYILEGNKINISK